MKHFKLYSIKVRWVENLGCWWFQLIDSKGTRPGPKPATLTIPARVYSKRYKSLKIGAKHFTKYREELERLVN